MKAISFAAGCLFASTALAQEPVLTVYAGDYVVSEWGPGPKIEEMFEARCGCDLQFKPGDLLPRLLLEGDQTEADVVFGLNTDVTKKARESGLFAPHGVDLSPLTLPIDWTDDTFLPYNYGETAFIYDTTRLSEPPTSFAELLDAPDDLKIVIQDPRSSISGLAMALWVEAVFGDEAEDAWRKLAPKILTVTKGWSESYGLFTDGEADMVLSYTTSPAYHIIAEEDYTKKALIFPEGNYFMVELAAKLANTDQPELAQDFMDFILTPEFQQMIATGNWSFPAALPHEDWPEGFKELELPSKVLFYSEDEAAALRDEAIEAWRRGLSQ
ncbi:thiamine ABC transporter substrate binding subunit [Salipiger sp. PrR002]|uniref:thiamine ABC transporter substrate-binding protein n=1 Tax=Salipiger sp. PrR002 TaxID=2706489 RepID=UPI0013BDCE33|nr:thiamine ABC transporter substrate binding subunit [Salipiger sp. PrR002]NDW01705.1 thiamine ABC transporter substrate-binding protein [Salipiger sp. PrR002]NDW59209.1 thiamine ABC transporter substrate-binding protein [Salipiger sp. PrR004]